MHGIFTMLRGGGGGVTVKHRFSCQIPSPPLLSYHAIWFGWLGIVFKIIVYASYCTVDHDQISKKRKDVSVTSFWDCLFQMLWNEKTTKEKYCICRLCSSHFNIISALTCFGGGGGSVVRSAQRPIIKAVENKPNTASCPAYCGRREVEGRWFALWWTGRTACDDVLYHLPCQGAAKPASFWQSQLLLLLVYY